MVFLNNPKKYQEMLDRENARKRAKKQAAIDAQLKAFNPSVDVQSIWGSHELDMRCKSLYRFDPTVSVKDVSLTNLPLSHDPLSDTHSHVFCSHSITATQEEAIS